MLIIFLRLFKAQIGLINQTPLVTRRATKGKKVFPGQANGNRGDVEGCAARTNPLPGLVSFVTF